MELNHWIEFVDKDERVSGKWLLKTRDVAAKD